MTELQRCAVGGSTVQVGFDIQRLVNEGWEIDPDNPLTSGPYGSMQVGFIRDPDNAKDAAPARTRAEILAGARAAKAAKKEQGGGTNE